jgi:IclR family KDG regulon transcriptional repressor
MPAQNGRIDAEEASTQRVDSTLQKGLQILEALAASPRPLGITDLSKSLKMNKSNVHRLVKSLCTLNYLTQNSDRSYRPSLKLWKLGSAVMSHDNLSRLCAGEMSRLAQKTAETINLSVLDGLQTLYIDKIDSAQSVRTYTERGGNGPLHCVATGKVLLAYSYDALRGPVSKILEKHTPKTIISIKALDAEMAEIRKVGYAINTGEYSIDAGGIAAPIFDPEGKILAAIGVSGPLSRLNRQKLKDLAGSVIQAAKSVSAAIKAQA